MLTFFLRKKQDPILPIYGRYYGDGKDMQINTGLTIEPSKWNDRKGRAKRGTTPSEIEWAKGINDKLDRIVDTVNIMSVEYGRNGWAFTRYDILNIFANIINPKATETEPVQKIPSRSISEYINYLISAMDNGTFKVSGEDYRPQTIKMWKVFAGVFEAFERHYVVTRFKTLRWEDIDKSTYDDFVNFSKDRGYMTATINNQIACFKAVIKYSGKYHHLHKNTDVIVHFHMLKRKENDSRARIYLKADEVEALYNMRLKPGSLYEKVRDIFCAGIYCGQRFSDYGRLSPEHFMVTEKGTRVVRLVQKKTGQTVIVPFLNDNLQRLAAKYNYDFPEIDEVVVNKYIKLICRRLSETVPSLCELVPTALTLPESRLEEKYRQEHNGDNLFKRDEYGRTVKQRWELVTTHTARRTAITNLFKSHAFSNYQLMAISGHKTIKNLLLYVRESEEEVADEIDKLLKQKRTTSTAGLF